MRRFKLPVVLLALTVSIYPLLAKKKKPEEITQTLELPKDPPATVTAETSRLVFHVSPLSGKGLLSAQVRDALKALLKSSSGATIVKLRAFVAERGDDPRTLPHIYARMINTAIADVPADMTKAMHLCRGNFQSSFVASGGYEPVAEILFSAIDIDAYFMEYDSDRAGGFEPLRFVPKGKMVVLGLVASKSGTLEAKDAIKRRIEQATKFIDPDQLCLSPQCGFASTEEGDTLTEDEQWAKLRLIVEVADEVWG